MFLEPKPCEILFRKNGRHFFINPQAVCKASELETIRQQIETRAATLKYPEKPKVKKVGRKKRPITPTKPITEAEGIESDKNEEEQPALSDEPKKREKRESRTGYETSQSNPSETAIRMLEELKVKWDELDFQAIVKQIGEIYIIFSDGNRRQTKFVNVASDIFGCERDYINEIIEEYLMSVDGAKCPVSGKELLTGKDVHNGKHPGRKKFIKVEGAGQVSYDNIEQEWPNLSWHQRALAIGLFFRLETDYVGDKAFESLCSKIKFLDKNTIAGYLEIANLPATKKVVNDKLFYEDMVPIIGHTRMEFGKLFSMTELYTAMFKAVRHEKNLGDDGCLMPKFVLDFQGDLEKLRQAINDIKPVDYTINPKSPFSKAYKGILGEKFKPAPLNDPEYPIWLERLEPKPSDILFKGSKSWFAIDVRAVCEASEIAESDTDYGFEDTDDEEENSEENEY